MNNIFLKSLAILFLCLIFSQSIAQPAKVHVFVMDIRSEIDPRTSRYVTLALEEAIKTNADYLLINMDTYGGTLNDADKIRTGILNFPKPVLVFINPNAASAGALISIACDSIYMSSGASIGAATVVNGAGGEAAPDKYQSYMRSLMRSTAETNGRNPRIAEAMVDQTIQLDSIKQEGKVITLTTAEAIKYGYCDGRANSIEEVLKLNNIENYRISQYELSTAEKIISLFLNPFISGLLILAIIGGIYFELQSPGYWFSAGDCHYCSCAVFCALLSQRSGRQLGDYRIFCRPGADRAGNICVTWLWCGRSGRAYLPVRLPDPNYGRQQLV
jgi:membrane-bound serine protease (ClpP class)